MKLTRIESLDLRSAKVIAAEKRQQYVDAQGWWTDWDAVEWFPPRRRIRVNIVADTRAFQEGMRRMSEAINAATMSMFAMTPGFKAILGAKPRPWWRRWL